MFKSKYMCREMSEALPTSVVQELCRFVFPSDTNEEERETAAYDAQHQKDFTRPLVNAQEEERHAKHKTKYRNNQWHLQHNGLRALRKCAMRMFGVGSIRLMSKLKKI
jgi:hypothetical protein